MNGKRNLEADDDDDNGVVVAKKQLVEGDVGENTDEVELVNDEFDNGVAIETEKLFGICEYTNPDISGFFGIIKQRISDFLVNEIDQKGNVIHLTSYDVPLVEPIEEPKVEVDPELSNKLKSVIGEEKFNEVIEFCKKNDKNSKIQLNAPKEKEHRKMVHDFIKSTYEDHTSNTVDAKSGQLIEIYHKNFNGATTRGSFKRNSKKIEFTNCMCAMYKDNIDTLQAVNTIAKNLRIQPKRISYAGTKDKRGRTCQLISIFKVEPADILRLNNRCNHIKLGNFSLSNESLRLGDLNGNRFSIVLRQVKGDNELVEKCVDSLKTNGFINYYGLQRFGTSEIATHEIGKLLLLQKFKEAIDLILKPRRNLNERDQLKRARQIWENTHNAQDAYDLIQHLNVLEKYLLHGLINCDKTDYLGAFNYIPRNMRLMYIHAYQSYVWNMIASERVKKFGFKPIIGDLVYDKTSSSTESDQVIHLTESNISNYNIEDVLLPLPGFNMIYPKNEIYESYKTLISNDGLDITKMKNQIKDISLSGDYRNLIVKPSDFEYNIVYYKDHLTDLILSDLDLLNKKVLHGVFDKYDETNAPLKALIVKFNLKTSCYATMALRELLKLDTSKSFQTSLNST